MRHKFISVSFSIRTSSKHIISGLELLYVCLGEPSRLAGKAASVTSTTTGDDGGQAIFMSAATFLLNLVDKWVHRLQFGFDEAHLRRLG
jgi:hypothetical protein